MSLIHVLLLTANATSGTATAAQVPDQNLNKPLVTSLTAFDPEPLLKELNGTLTSEDVAPLFFPLDAFQQVKGIKDPAAYHKQLVSWFAADIKREKARLAKGAPWTVDSFKMGGCKWKEKGSEANALPYWSCFKNKLKLKNAKNESELVEIRVLINWGTTWYITHLGPIPKSH